jgi:hypothetical protein
MGGSSLEGRVKGSVLLSRLAFVRDQRGELALEALLAAMTEDDRRILSGMVLAFGWYSFDLATRLDAAIAKLMGVGEQIFLMLGARSAADNLGTSHRGFIKERDPHGLLKHAASIYRLYYDSGHRTYERISDHKAIVRTHESATFSRADCLTVVGWHERAIQMCGGRNARVTEPRCRARGSPICEYVCEWDA